MEGRRVRNAKIVCTLGPASEDHGTIRDLVQAGMSVARLNASHGSVDDRRQLIETIRGVDEETATPVATMLDIAGPEVRTADIDGEIEIVDGSEVVFYHGDDATPERIGLSRSISAVEPGDKVLLDDGRIVTTVTEVDGEEVHATVEDGGPLTSRKGVNTPGADLGFDPVTEADRKELELAAEKEVEFVAASHIRNADDVYAVSEILEEEGVEVPIVAKIEQDVAVDNLDEIVDAAYGIMVARGDLGVECPLEQVPLIQKRIIRKCHETGTPVITATEMLDSMIHEGRPTRAEASDVANAVLDGTDAVMLSAETAIGDHPVRVVETMDRIVRDVELSGEYEYVREQQVPEAGETRTDALARSARYLARDVEASAVVVASESGFTARKAAQYRPGVPIVASTPDHRVRRQLSLSCGVVPRHSPMLSLEDGDRIDTLIDQSVDTAIDTGIVESGDTVVVVSGMMTDFGSTDTSNTLKVHVAAETAASGRGVVNGRAVGTLHRITDGDLTDVPEGAIAALPEDFDDEFRGDTSKLAGIVHARLGMTGYPAIVARELGLPMISGAELPDDLEDGETITLDGNRGVIYRGEVTRR